MALNKLLFGWSIHWEMTTSPTLSEEDKKLCDSLLEAVIQNWNALGELSIDGFRTRFLMREALLSQKIEEWQLRVEQKPFDVLLTQLPWSISYIFLFWMEKRISVEWR